MLNRSVYAYPESEDGAELLKIDFQRTKALFDDHNEELKKQEMLAFLGDSIPGLRYRAKKEKFIKYFEKKVRPCVVTIIEGIQPRSCAHKRRRKKRLRLHRAERGVKNSFPPNSNGHQVTA